MTDKLIQKTKESFNKEVSLAKKLAFVKSCIVKGRFTRIEKGASTESFDSMVASLDFIYPERWDIYIDTLVRYKRRISNPAYTTSDSNDEPVHLYIPENHVEIQVYFVIHFPLLNITNSKAEKHTITDMYVKVRLYASNTGNLTAGSLEGKRFSATKRELSSNYLHSHLCSRSYGLVESYDKVPALHTWGSFCLGHGGIGTIIDKLYDKYSEADFKALLFMLQSYLEWESIEGGPYCYIKNIIGKAEPEDVSSRVPDWHYEKLKNIYSKAYAIVPELHFRIEGNYIFVEDDDNLETFLKYDGNNKSTYNSQALCTKDEKGFYYKYNSLPEKLPDTLFAKREILDKYNFIFRGKEVSFKEVQEQNYQEIEHEPEFYIHPKIKNYVTKRIEQSIQTARFRGSITKELSTLANNGANIKQDKVLV